MAATPASLLTYIVVKNLVLDLIQALHIEPAARTLSSQIADRSVSSDLAILFKRVDSNQLDIASAIPLVELIVRNEPGTPTSNDGDIWRTVFGLIARMSSSIRPTAFVKAASKRGIEQTHHVVDRRILDELRGRVYYDVGGFYERYFKGNFWTNNTRDIYEESWAQYTEGRWSDWPEPSLQGPFIESFIQFQDIVLSGLGRRYYTLANKVLRGSEADRKLDIFLTPTDTALPEGEHDWSNVLVIGKHKENPVEDRSAKTLVQLAGDAREVFGSQLERRFVPSFTICRSLMQVWVFNRSGPYNSEKFDIHKELERFVKVLAGYALMSDAELGLNTFIKLDGNGKYIVTRDVRISLEDKPIASTKAIRPGSTDSEYVVKFAWPSDNTQREGELLKLAKEIGVTGIAITIDGHPDTISYLRRAIKFGLPRRPLKKAFWVDSDPESSQAYSKTSLRGRSGSRLGAGSTTTSTSGLKRKRDERFDGVSRLKRPKFDCSHASATNLCKEDKLDDIGAPSIQETVVDSLAYCRNKWERNNHIQEADSLTDCESETYGNRVNYSLVTSPARRPLREYQSARELLEVLRDAIRDLAKELEGMPSSARHPTGTMQFMAIEVLEGKGHTYRHDLESFFYVFVWMCIRYGYGGTGRQKPKMVMRPKTNMLRGWYTGVYTEIANMKHGQFAAEFENLKPLSRELSSALFPIRDGDIFTGTFYDHSIMYDRMSEAFDKAITSLRKEEQANA
ncbi:hypothetical protein HOY82DRAFT_578732 [Tuber indicum]|nr:hypothetical protein HOY82DRAFT_578732 [Tuber indicum]